MPRKSPSPQAAGQYNFLVNIVIQEKIQFSVIIAFVKWVLTGSMEKISKSNNLDLPEQKKRILPKEVCTMYECLRWSIYEVEKSGDWGFNVQPGDNR